MQATIRVMQGMPEAINANVTSQADNLAVPSRAEDFGLQPG